VLEYREQWSEIHVRFIGSLLWSSRPMRCTHKLCLAVKDTGTEYYENVKESKQEVGVGQLDDKSAHYKRV
jgi:hypothetical protein